MCLFQKALAVMSSLAFIIYRSLWGMVIGLIPCSIGAAIYYWVF